MEIQEGVQFAGTSPKRRIFLAYIRPSIAEFFGVFFLTFGIHCSGTLLFLRQNPEERGMITVIEPVVAVFLFIGVFSFTRPVSGGHLNPVITVILVASKTILPFVGLLYVVAQVSGAALGALCVKIVTGKEVTSIFLKPGVYETGRIIFAEMMGSLVVILAYLTLTSKSKGNVAILGIGFGYAGALIAVHGASSGFLNPVLNFGVAVATGEWHKQYVYVVGTALGGIIAAILYRLIFAPIENLWLRPRNAPERIA